MAISVTALRKPRALAMSALICAFGKLRGQLSSNKTTDGMALAAILDVRHW